MAATIVNNMPRLRFLSGNQAVAEGVRLAGVPCISAYPITPQTTIVETLAEMVADRRLDAEFLEVESEHSALSACLGAAACGLRTFTATSSQGLLYMHEILHYVSGARLPVVMAVATRALAPPWNIFGDQRDSVSQRDTGWIQLYAETAQEALDTILQAYRIAEDPTVLTPVMVCLDGFTVSHTYEPVDAPEPEQVMSYLPPFTLEGRLDETQPTSMCFSAPPNWNTQFKQRQQDAIIGASAAIIGADREFRDHFGRGYGGLVEHYQTEGAEAILVAMGGICGTIKEVVDSMREQGLKVGLLRIRSLRPFPVEAVRDIAARCPAIGVVDRNVSFGYEGAVFTEVKGAVYSMTGARPGVHGFIAGLGGRDIGLTDVVAMYRQLMDARVSERGYSTFWE